MTRINCIPVTELCDKHLLSEYYELPRIFSWLSGVLEKDRKPKIPNKFVLGTGHMSFFADKLTYLNKRHVDIVQECLRRKKKVVFTEKLCWCHIGIPLKYWNDWQPDTEAQALNRERINERLKAMKEKADAKIKQMLK